MSGISRAWGGTPHPRNVDLDPGAGDGLPALGGSGFDLQRLRFAISGARLRPPNLDPHDSHRELPSSPNNQTKEEAAKVDTDPRAVDGCEYRKTAKHLYAQVQTKGRRDESVLATARRTYSRRRGRSENRRTKVEYTDIGKKNLNK